MTIRERVRVWLATRHPNLSDALWYLHLVRNEAPPGWKREQ